MKAMIRWPGLGVFGVTILLIGLFTFFFADDMIESLIEKQGSKLVGARVDLKKADLSFFPAGLELSGLAITNPDQPMRNMIEIDRLAFAIDPLRLLQRKFIVDEMAVDGIRPDTPRKKSGAIAGQAARQKEAASRKKGKGFEMPSLQIPDAKEVLAKEQLTTLTLAREYQEQIKADMANWQQELGDLPDKEKLSGYRERLSKLKSGAGLTGLIGGASGVASLRKEIQSDMDRLKNAQKNFDRVTASYRERLAELQKAPSKDINRLVDKYSLSGSGLANLSPLLFGDKAGGTIGQALSWYKKAKPLLERAKKKKGGSEVVKPTRGKGVFVRFREDEPLPDFLVRKIKASVVIEAGSFDGTITNVTPDQDILAIPLTFAFAGDSLKGLRSISFDGVLEHIDPARSNDTFNLKVAGYLLDKAELGSDKSLPVGISGGLLDLSARAMIRQEEINADIEGGLKSATITATAKESDSASQAIAGALTGITELSVRARVTGPIDDYRIQLNSDLDKILKQAVSNTLKSQTAKFKKELKAGVMEKAKGPLAGAGTSFAGLGSISGELGDRLKMGGNLIQ